MEKKRTTLYFTPAFHDSLKKIASREQVGMGQLVEQKMESFVRLHVQGNPQQTIRRYTEKGVPYVAPRKCYRKHCAEPATGTAVWKPTGTEYAVCAKHLAEIKAMKHSGRWQVTDKKVGE